ncbi:S-layer homology domain-containing protein [Sporosarcina sp. FA9]|uniref:S-layer homology domain-containing protein n=1 Tax=Sporosarcina sp. FA9 TaxID=3413030 RepID=UPI003F657CDB
MNLLSTFKGTSLVISMIFILTVLPIFTNAASPFKDVKSNHYASSSIEWAYDKGLIKGYPDGTFQPDKKLTEAQFAAMLIRYDCSSPDSFTSAKGKHYASGNYKYLQSNNIPLNGLNSDKSRDLPITKGQVARIIAAFNGVDLSESQAILYMYINDLASGATGKNDYTDYGAQNTLSRADATIFFDRLSKTGNCNLRGLNRPATGKDNSKYELPPNFYGDGVVFFPPTDSKPKPPVLSPPIMQTIAVDIEKPTLIANGVDSTFVTVSLRSCSGEPISYDESLSFRVTSELGAKLDDGKFGQPAFSTGTIISNAEATVKNAETKATNAWAAVDNAQSRLYSAQNEWNITFGNLEKYLEPFYLIISEATKNAKNANTELMTARAHLAAVQFNVATSTIVNTDGPDLTVEITAPAVGLAKTETLSFKAVQNNNVDCFIQPVTVQLKYVPQAELRIEKEEKMIPNAQGISIPVTEVTATIIRPGGDLIKSFNGRVQFSSTEGANLSNQYADFSNGVARTTVTNIQSSQSIIDVISAEIDLVDVRFKDEINSVLNTKHRIELLYDAPLQVEASCPIGDLEIAFVLDSSGSMRVNDRQKLRVSKSEELIEAIKAPNNISARFSSNGVLLSPSKSVSDVHRTFAQVGQSGGTNIGKGLQIAFKEFITPASGQKIAILLTDGKSSTKQINDALKMAKDKKIRIYTIGLGKPTQLQEPLLQQLARDTGGQYYHVERDIDIGIAYQSILSEITCGTPPPTCAIPSQAFSSSVIEYTSSDLFMFTDIREGCGEIARVVVRFNSFNGDVDYELISRGQNHFALRKGLHEISNFTLYRDAEFLAFNRDGKLVGNKIVHMTRK